MISTVFQNILYSLPIIATIILLQFSINILFYITNYVSLIHAGLYLIGAYLFVEIAHMLGASVTLLNLLLWFFLVSLIIGGVSVVLYYGVLRYVESDVHQMLLTFGLVFSTGGLVKYIWGVTPVTFGAPLGAFGQVGIGGVTVPVYYIIVFVLALGVMGLIAYFFHKTDLGLQFRALSLEREMAESFGTDERIVTIITFLFAGMLAGLAGCFMVPIGGAAYGAQINALLLAFLALIIGGIASIRGAILAGVILGLSQTFTAYYIPELELAVIYIIAIIVLVSRPYGLLGRKYEH